MAHSSSIEEQQIPILQFTSSDYGIKILTAGERLQHWIKIINDKRQEQNIAPLVLYKGGGGSPIFNYDSPYYLGPLLIMSKLDLLKKEMPQAMLDILFSKSELLPIIPEGLSDEKFTSLAHSFKRIYLEVIEWQDVEVNYAAYKMRANRDVRPYYQLLKLNSLEAKMAEFNKMTENKLGWLSAADQRTIEKSLLGMCLATNVLKEACEAELDEAIRNKNIEKMYHQYIDLAKYWVNFPFKISPSKRNTRIHLDIVNKQIIVPFFDPKDEVREKFSTEDPDQLDRHVEQARNFIKENIELEFKLEGWQVLIQFTDNNETAAAKLQFVEGSYAATENASVIKMGKLESFDDNFSKWSITHEFGHVLGFEDCYLRFIDRENPNQLVYYSIDPQNLMCAVGGKFNKTMLNEIISVYAK